MVVIARAKPESYVMLTEEQLYKDIQRTLRYSIILHEFYNQFGSYVQQHSLHSGARCVGKYTSLGDHSHLPGMIYLHTI